MRKSELKLSDLANALRAKLQELENELVEKNASIEVRQLIIEGLKELKGREIHYKGIIDGLESQIKKIQKNELELSDWGKGLTARLKELEKKLVEKNSSIEVRQLIIEGLNNFKKIEKHFKGIVSDLQIQLKKTPNDLKL